MGIFISLTSFFSSGYSLISSTSIVSVCLLTGYYFSGSSPFYSGSGFDIGLTGATLGAIGRLWTRDGGALTGYCFGKSVYSTTKFYISNYFLEATPFSTISFPFVSFTKAYLISVSYLT